MIVYSSNKKGVYLPQGNIHHLAGDVNQQSIYLI